MMKLSKLHESYIKRHTETTLGANNPTICVKKNRTPLVPVERWQKLGNHLVRKNFNFRSLEQRNRFMAEILVREDQEGHHAVYVVDHSKVTIEVGSEDMGVITELDRELADFADLLYRDVTYNDTLHGYEVTEQEYDEFDGSLLSDDEF